MLASRRFARLLGWPSPVILGVIFVIFLLLGTLAWLFGATYLYGLRTSGEQADAAIVLGAAVWGEEPCPVFRERINHGLALYREGRVKRILMTGGRGDATRPAESIAARNYAVRQGVPPDAILVETASRSTYENMVYSKEVMEANGLRSALIVSDPIHMRRAMVMARDVGIDARPAPTPTSRYISPRKKAGFVWRETRSYIAYKLFG